MKFSCGIVVTLIILNNNIYLLDTLKPFFGAMASLLPKLWQNIVNIA